jgi:hypothetical protein
MQSFYRFYTETLYFERFVETNEDALRRILKKYNKLMPRPLRNRFNED